MRRLSGTFLTAVLCAALAAPAQAALRAPALSGPAGQASVPALPTFYWNKVANAAAYDFQLSASPKFTSVVNGKGPGRGAYRTRNTAATLSKTAPDGIYYWRVRAVSKRDTAGKWSPARAFTKAWTAAPVLQHPTDELSVSWPALPLVLRWSVVPHAVKYHVTIATDPSLASPVLGSPTRPQETSGTTFALPASLAQGRYYWAVTPVDAQGNKGTASRTGSFDWLWPTTTQTRVDDANDTAAVFDPLLSWAPVPGAAKYEVQVNYSEDFAASSEVCCKDAVIGTSLAPTLPLQNNTYYWRMRAIDSDDNAGAWNHGPSFKKAFDDLAPSIPNLRMRDTTTDPLPGPVPSTGVPIVQWDPVAGASSYRVQVLTHTGSGCNYGMPVSTDETAISTWAPLGGYTNGASYCIRVQARSDRPITGMDNGYVSDWTQINGVGQAAFTYVSPTPPAGPNRDAALADDYLGPVGGTVSPRTPVFAWKPIPGATSYRVRVARDPSFTTIVDNVVTSLPVYTPGSGLGIVNYTDETTTYYWAVVPRQGNAETSTPAQNSPQSFEKRSAPPGLLYPADGASVTTQPTFRWTPAEGARKYHLLVAQDPTFANPIDDVTTTSTAYTSSSTYPADTVIYWRVRAIVEDEPSDLKLTASPTQRFQRRLDAPALAGDNPSGGSDIPALSWAPVEGAVSYGFHVDKSDGKSQDFTIKSTTFTPTTFYGTGVWRWKVRANFPARSGTVSSSYSAPQQYVRTIPPPDGARAVKTASRVLIFWDPSRIAKAYRVEISPTSGFGTRIASVETDNTSWAPDLRSPAFKDGGTMYWRVANVDDGGNVGAWSTGSFVLPKRIAVRVAGALRRGVRRAIVVKLQDAKGRAVAKASVSVTGAGMRRAHKRTGRRGTVRLSLLPRRRGAVVIRVTRRGYTPASVTVRAY